MGSRASRKAKTPPVRVQWRTEELLISDEMPIHAGLAVAESVNPPDYDLHYGLEFGVVLSRRMRRHYRSWSTEMGPGDVWYCGIWEPHGWEALEVPCTHLVITMMPNVLARPQPLFSPHRHWLEPFIAPPERRPRTSDANRQQVLALASQFPLGADLSAPAERVRLRLLTFELLLLVGEKWHSPAEVPLPSPDLYDSVKAALELLLEDPLGTTPQRAARLCRMSRNAFDRAFRSVMGVPFGKFALRYRLGEAAAQLVRSTDTIKNIARDWGFTDDSHLHSVFRQHYGCSPTEYRNRRRTSQVW